MLEILIQVILPLGSQLFPVPPCAPFFRFSATGVASASIPGSNELSEWQSRFNVIQCSLEERYKVGDSRLRSCCVLVVYKSRVTYPFLLESLSPSCRDASFSRRCKIPIDSSAGPVVSRVPRNIL